MTATPEEVEFLAEREPIRIVPNFNSDKLYLIGGDVGPFKAGFPLQVPLWLALHLRERLKCRILIPDWMDLANLERIKEDEGKTDVFTQMPSEHYMIIAKLLFEACGQDIPNSHELRTVIKDIWDIRASKLRTSVSTFLASGLTNAEVNNLTQLEMTSTRPFFLHAIEQSFRIKKTARVGVEVCDRGSQSMSMSETMNSQSQSQSESQSESQ